MPAAELDGLDGRPIDSMVLGGLDASRADVRRAAGRYGSVVITSTAQLSERCSWHNINGTSPLRVRVLRRRRWSRKARIATSMISNEAPTIPPTIAGVCFAPDVENGAAAGGVFVDVTFDVVELGVETSTEVELRSERALEVVDAVDIKLVDLVDSGI